MKKIIISLLIIASLTLTGCANGLSQKSQKDYQKAAETASKSLIEDKYYVAKTLETETELVAYSIEEDVKYNIEFFYVDEDGETTNATLTTAKNVLNDFEYREWFKYDLVNQFMAMLEKNDKKPGQVVGTIVSWDIMGGLFFQDVKYAPSIIDIDADGVWDYITNSHACYFTTLPTEEKYPSRQINENITISLVSTTELIPLKDLNGKEKLKSFEDYLQSTT